MAAYINTNIASLNSQRNLTSSQTGLTTSLQRLSSGLRINSAKDDSAGLAIADRMTSQIRGQNQAVRNANDGISIAQTAEGALAEVGNNLQRIRELAVQSANASNSQSDRDSLNTEAQQLKSEVDRVATTTSFNNVKLLNGSFSSQSFQVGANAGEVINVSSIADARSSALGSNVSATATGVTASGFATAVTGAAGALTIKDASNNDVEILGVGNGLLAAADATERSTQVRDAVNNKSAQTGVFASLDASNKVTLTSSHAISVAGTEAANTVGLGVAAATSVAVSQATTTVKGFASLDLSSAGGATAAIGQMDSALTALNTARSSLGAYQNRFSSAISSLQTTSENLSASRSRIQDTDFASETANMTRGQILQQAGTAMLAQANSLPNGVLALLRG